MRRGGVDEEAPTRRSSLGGVGEGEEASERRRQRGSMRRRGGVDEEASARRRWLGGVGEG